MANFKIGQKVVCIKAGWVEDATNAPTSGPKINEELVIHSFDSEGYLQFVKYGLGDSFIPTAFTPASTIKESQKYAEKLLKEIIIEIEEENSVLK